MFTAMVLFCSVYVTGDCLDATDSKGPYLTEEACHARIEEMIAATRFMLPHLAPIGTKCDYDAGNQT